ncbi:MAG TPA: mannonate dehydratase [Clostridia bacterium]|jgi:mannonate dehydratase|nr:mannonate dehydratase [Clostridia bacterium]HUM61399.1 mannonate dehydratase [Clostridia bacterium]
MMKTVTGGLKYFNEVALIRGKQLGMDAVLLNRPPLWGKDEWSEKAVQWMVDYCAKFGMIIAGVENIPVEWFTPIVLNYPERDECIERYLRIITAFGKAGIPYLGYGFAAGNVWRTDLAAKGRGGCRCMQYVKADENTKGNQLVYKNVIHGEMPSREELWNNYAYFLKAVLPHAEKEHVGLMLHPSDPPLPVVHGVPRIFCSIEDYKYAYELSGHSPAWGLNLCLGCISQMGGKDAVLEMIRYFGPKGKIFQVHLRDVIGSGESFTECFLGEGNYNPAQVLCELENCGFNGYVFEDHVPMIHDDDGYHTIGRAHAVGYIQGMIDMMKYLIKK